MAEVAAFLAGAVGEVELSLGATADERTTRRAFAAAARHLKERFFPPGDPLSGLPLSSGTIAVFRRHLARIVGGYLRQGQLDPLALERHAQYSARELLLLSEALSGLMGCAGPPDRRTRWVRSRQMARLGLRGPLLREARRRIAAPRPPRSWPSPRPSPSAASSSSSSSSPSCAAGSRARLPLASPRPSPASPASGPR